MTTSVEEWEKIKYFKPNEFSCKCGKCERDGGVSFILVQILDMMRHELGFPFKITSGLRCLKHPQSKEGKSSHARGLAVDIYINSSTQRFQLLNYVLKSGSISRVGIGMDFVHLDIDSSPDKAQRVMWTYY